MNEEKLKEEQSEKELTEEELKEREERKQAILEEIKKDVIAKSQMSKEDAEIALEMLDEADMPVGLTDEDFKLGKREIDIRKLSDENYKQMIFRTLITQGVWLRNISNLLVDLMRLIYVELDTLGVKNVLKECDVVLAKITRQRNEMIKEEILKSQKKDKSN